MRVCRFSRPTSCRPCLTSSIALSYRILSGSAVFSALVDLLTFFFLRNTCASDRVALSRSSPIITNRVHRIVVGRNVDHLAVASNEVRRNLHLSLESGVPRHPSIRARDVPAGSPRWTLFVMIGLLLLSATRSDAQVFRKKKKVNKSTSAENTAEPDKILYDKAIDDVKHGRHEVGRLNLQTLINTYPDSDYLAKAKLAIADSFYKEGGTANLTQAVQAYKDFDIFFPMLPEAAYAQLQVAMTHYKQMEKPDRDRTHARAAEEEFQTFLSKYPTDPLAPKAEQHLREVQELLAEGDFRIGYYYYVKEDKKAAESRLRAIVNRYPLYSKSDRALWMLGNIWESTEKKEIAAPYYARIVRNYPLSD